ncbi:MAG: nucleoside/nucleotide kinase family protein [Lachnospiraceae bacterium]|nr:nucleoside/nucleotide kinase family protein [Lachnospiraceae bacterium]
MNYDVLINGIEVNAHYSEESINKIFIPLLKRFCDIQEKKGSRILVMLAAPPGAGKSTLLSFLKHLSENTEGLRPVTTIGIDGFHHYQDYLLNHTTIRDGKEIQMVKIKGAPITFDVDMLRNRIKKVASGEVCGWPEYDRMKHNPVEDAIQVTGDIIILEGNYLLLNDDRWSNLADYADLTIKIDADIDMLRGRLIERKMMSGAEAELAKEFVEYSDLYNAKLCITNSKDADITLKLKDDDEYELV